MTLTRRSPLHPHWRGYLSAENYTEVAEHMQQLLGGKRYTFVATCEGHVRPTSVRTSCRLVQPIVSKDKLEDGYVYISCLDNGYSWGIHTSAPTERAAAEGHRADQTYVSFYQEARGEGMTVEQFNGLGERLHWTVQVEDDDLEQLAGRDALIAKIREQISYGTPCPCVRFDTITRLLAEHQTGEGE